MREVQQLVAATSNASSPGRGCLVPDLSATNTQTQNAVSANPSRKWAVCQGEDALASCDETKRNKKSIRSIKQNKEEKKDLIRDQQKCFETGLIRILSFKPAPSGHSTPPPQIHTLPSLDFMQGTSVYTPCGVLATQYGLRVEKCEIVVRCLGSMGNQAATRGPLIAAAHHLMEPFYCRRHRGSGMLHHQHQFRPRCRVQKANHPVWLTS